MIDQIISILGYSGSDPAVTYLIVGASLSLVVGLSYTVIRFLLSIISSILGADYKIM